MIVDFNLLTYVKTSRELNATGQRWENELEDYKFFIHYKPAIENTVEDVLSRYPLDNQESLKVFKASCKEDEVRIILDIRIFIIKSQQASTPLRMKY